MHERRPSIEDQPNRLHSGTEVGSNPGHEEEDGVAPLGICSRADRLHMRDTYTHHRNDRNMDGPSTTHEGEEEDEEEEAIVP